jgi:hypothetical protein
VGIQIAGNYPPFPDSATAARHPVKVKVLGSNPSRGAMENVDYFDVQRVGNDVVITFYDIVEQGEELTLPVEDAWKLMRALKSVMKVEKK